MDDDDYIEDYSEDSALHAAVCLDPRDPARVARASRAWLQGGWEKLYGEIAQAKAAGDRDVSVSVRVSMTERDPLRGRQITADRWAEALDSFQQNPVNVAVNAFVKGKKLSYGHVRLAVTRVVDSNPWVRLVTRAMLGKAFDPATAYDRWVDVLTEVLTDADPLYGEINHDGGDDIGTELELALRRDDYVGMAQGRSWLRGYSWVTVVPQELVERLGGADAMEAVGAVAEVRRLPSGGVVLRATPSPEEYDEKVMRRLFLLLAPVLPPRQPRTVPGRASKHRVVYEDAANHR